MELQKGITRIRKRDGRIVDFNQEKITEAIWKAARAVGGRDRNLAKRLSNQVVGLLVERFAGEVPGVEDIQDIVEKVLIEDGHARTAKAYILYRKQRESLRKIKSTFLEVEKIVSDYLNQIDWRVRENSNIGYSMSGLLMHVSGSVLSQYTLDRIYPMEVADAHRNGDFHLHDLYFGISGYCAGWSIKQLLYEGFNGVPGAIESNPPRHLDTALMQMVNFIGTLQNEWAGAQAFNSIDTYLAPFVRKDNLNYKEIKQAIQKFVFNLNITSRWGSQSPFTNLTFDWTVPEDVKNEPVILGGKLLDETYKDYQKEMDLLNRAFIEVLMEGDRNGRPFTFPIPTYNLTRDFDWEGENTKLLFEMTAKYGLPYFCLDENMEVITKKEPKKIKEISEEDEVLDEKGEFHKTIFKKKIESGENIIIKGKDFEVICSKNHRFPTVEGLKKAGELSLKDKLLKYEKHIEFENRFIIDSSSKQFFGIEDLQYVAKQKFIKLSPVRKIKGFSEFFYHKNRFQTTLKQKVKIPKDLDKDLMELFGIVLGDGSLGKNKVRVVNTDEEIIKFVMRVFKEKFGLTSSIRKAGHSKVCKEISTNSAVLTSFLEYLGLEGNTYTKRIPEICFWRSDEEIGALLRGLFDTDGSITLNRRKDHIISIYFSNKELTNDVLLLLAKLGIVGKENKVKGSKRICITGSRNIELFKKLVGFRIKRKQKLLQYPVKDTNKPSIGDKIVSAEEASYIDKHYLYQGKEFVRVRSEEREPYLFIRSYKKDIQPVDIEKIKIDRSPRILYDITMDSPSHQFVLKNGIISHNSNFINSDLNPSDVRSMCCRLRLNLRQLDRNITGGLFGSGDSTGSVGVVTINMPRIGNLAKTSLEIKRGIVERNMNGGLLPYTKRYLGTLRNHFSTIGPLGMNEVCLNLFGKNIASKEGKEFTLEVLKFMRGKLQDFQEETGHIYNLEAVPCEGTSFRLARIDKKKYPDIITAGERVPYYTNSTLLPVDTTDDVIEALEHQEDLQTLYTGGTVFHIFLGEKMSSGEACKRLIKRIMSNSRIPYLTITPTYSICSDHGYLAGEHLRCPICGKSCDVYSRVVGYFRPVRNWNEGKQEEFRQRTEYKVES